MRTRFEKRCHLVLSLIFVALYLVHLLWTPMDDILLLAVFLWLATSWVTDIAHSLHPRETRPSTAGSIPPDEKGAVRADRPGVPADLADDQHAATHHGGVSG